MIRFPPDLTSIVIELGERSYTPFDPRQASFRERVDFDRGRLTDLVGLAGKCARGGTVLDLGAPPFIVTAALVHDGYDVVANGLPVPGYGTDGRVVFRFADASERAARLSLFDAEEDFPLASDSFDVVIAGEVFEHLYRQPWIMLAEAWRCLRREGVLLITTPNGHNIDVLLNWLRRGSTGMGFNPEAPSIRHAREYGVDELRAVIESQGFRVDRVFTRNYSHIGPDGFPGRLGPVKRSIYRGLHVLSERPAGPLGNRGQTTFVAATRLERAPSRPPDFMLYGCGDPQTGYNFERRTSAAMCDGVRVRE